MNSRERILATLHRKPVDRLPVDLGGTRQTGIAARAYHRLRERLGLATGRPVRVFDLCQMLAEVEQSDCVWLPRPAVEYNFGIENGNWKRWQLHDGTPVEVPGGFHPVEEPDGCLVLMHNGVPAGRMPRGGFYFERVGKFPGAAHPNLSTWRPPRVANSAMEHYAQQAEALDSGTDKAIVAAFGPAYDLFYAIGHGGFEDWMMTFASEPEYVQELYGLMVEAWLDDLKRFYAAVGNRVHVIILTDDFGMQSAPFLSETMFRELVLPAYKRGFDWIHANTPWKVLLHSDGAIFSLIPALIDMGVDILNPVQTSAAGMDPVKIKAAFGDKLLFWGGACDCQNTLTFGTPQQVAAEVRINVPALARGGGLVLGSVHNIQDNVPPDNIITMFDTAREFDGFVRKTSAEAATGRG